MSIGSGNAGNAQGACAAELLNPVAPEETGETKPLFLTAGRMLEVTPAANFSYWQEVKVKTDKGGSCLARVGGNSRFGLPQYAAGQKLEYRQQIRGSGEGDTASYHLLRSEEGEVLWADYSGTLRRHAKEGPPRIALEIVPDASPTCQRRYDVKNPLPHIAFGLTFRTAQGECRLDPLSSALCKLWGKPYRVVIDQFGGDMLNYAIVKDELFRPQAQVSESITKNKARSSGETCAEELVLAFQDAIGHAVGPALHPHQVEGPGLPGREPAQRGVGARLDVSMSPSNSKPWASPLSSVACAPARGPRARPGARPPSGPPCARPCSRAGRSRHSAACRVRTRAAR